MHFYKLLSSEIETNMVSDRNADFTPNVMNVGWNVVQNSSRYAVMKFSEKVCLRYYVPVYTSWKLIPTGMWALDRALIYINFHLNLALLLKSKEALRQTGGH